MDALPRDIWLEVAKGAGLDGLRALGVRPGRLRVPPALSAALTASLSLRRELHDVNNDWVMSSVSTRIAGTDKFYVLSRRNDDAVRGIEHDVALHRRCAWNGVFFPLDCFKLYRGERPPRQSWSTTLVDLDASLHGVIIPPTATVSGTA